MEIKNYTLEEVHNYKEECERELNQALKSFEQQTGLKITHISYINRDIMENPSVKISIEL